LQTVGQLIGQLQDAESIPKELMNIGCCVSVICNLVEGLNVLQVNVAHLGWQAETTQKMLDQ
jgi:hypothetical protein